MAQIDISQIVKIIRENTADIMKQSIEAIVQQLLAKYEKKFSTFDVEAKQHKLQQ